jgi:hypothetical protein
VQNSSNENFKIKVWTAKGDGGTYKLGELLHIYFATNMDCFIKIYHVDVNGRQQLIFPNKYHTSNAIKSGQVYKIPDESYGFTFNIVEPLGAEFIKVIASTVQFIDIEAAFADMGQASKEKVMKGLSVQAKKEMVSEALISHTVIK